MIISDLKSNYGKSGVIHIPVALIFCPGFSCACLYRVSSYFYKYGAIGRIISRIFWLLNILIFSCHIHPASKIGPGISMPHPTGIVIGMACVIGSNTTIFQNVTLGSASESEAAYPTIETGVKIYANAVLVGGIKIGKNSIIGANSFVSKSAPEHSLVVGVPASIRTLSRRH